MRAGSQPCEGEVHRRLLATAGGGGRPAIPLRSNDVSIEPDALTVVRPHPEGSSTRGDTLNEPLLTVRCTSPAPVRHLGVGRVIIWAGRPRRPQFESDHRSIDVSSRMSVENDAALPITSGALTARFQRGEAWSLEFRGRRPGAHRERVQGDGAARHRLGRDPISESSSGSKWANASTAWVSASAPGQERTGGREHEQGRRHRQRTGVQERAVLSLQRAATACWSTIPARSRSKRDGEPRADAVQPRRRSAGVPPLRRPHPQGGPARVRGPDRPAGPAASLVVRAVADDLVHHPVRRGTATGFVDRMADRELPLAVFHFDCFWMREFQLGATSPGTSGPSPTRPACSRG